MTSDDHRVALEQAAQLAELWSSENLAMSIDTQSQEARIWHASAGVTAGLIARQIRELADARDKIAG